MTRALDRREVLGALAALGLGGMSLGCGDGRTHETLADVASRFSPGAIEEGRRLGRLYLDAHPAERDADELAAELVDGGALLSGPETAQRIQVEFARGELVAVDGWQLTRTEARLLAALALVDGESWSSR